MNHIYNRTRIDAERLEYFCPDCERTLLVAHSDPTKPISVHEFFAAETVFPGDVSVIHTFDATAENMQGWLGLEVDGDAGT